MIEDDWRHLQNWDKHMPLILTQHNDKLQICNCGIEHLEIKPSRIGTGECKNENDEYILDCRCHSCGERVLLIFCVGIDKEYNYSSRLKSIKRMDRGQLVMKWTVWD